MVAAPTVGQSYDCLSASGTALNDMPFKGQHDIENRMTPLKHSNKSEIDT